MSNPNRLGRLGAIVTSLGMSLMMIFSFLSFAPAAFAQSSTDSGSMTAAATTTEVTSTSTSLMPAAGTTTEVTSTTTPAAGVTTTETAATPAAGVTTTATSTTSSALLTTTSTSTSTSTASPTTTTSTVLTPAAGTATTTTTGATVLPQTGGPEIPGMALALLGGLSIVAGVFLRRIRQ